MSDEEWLRKLDRELDFVTNIPAFFDEAPPYKKVTRRPPKKVKRKEIDL